MSEKENQNTKKNTVFRLIAKSLGEKSGKNDEEADKIAIIRILMFLSIFITNSFIIANAIRHWHDQTQIDVYIEGACNQRSTIKTVNRTLEFE